MPDLTIEVIFQDIKKVVSEAIVVGFFDDVRPLKGVAGQIDWLLCGSLSRLLLKNKLRGSLGDVALISARHKIPAQKIFMVGLGSRSSFSFATVRTAARIAAASVVGAGASSMALEYISPHDTSLDACISALREGLQEGVGAGRLAVSLLAPDQPAFEQISQLVTERIA